MFIETQMGNKIKHLRSDNRGEYVNEGFKTYCKEHSIHIEYTAPHLPHNSIVSPLRVLIPCSFRKTYQSRCGQKQSDTLHTSRIGHHIGHSPKILHHTKHSQRRSQTWVESKSLGPNARCSIERTWTNLHASRTKQHLLDTRVTGESSITGMELDGEYKRAETLCLKSQAQRSQMITQ